MALTERVILDIQSAERQINQLDAQLATLSTPIDIPVRVGDTGQITAIRQDLGQADDAVENLNRELSQTDDALRRAGREADTTGDAMLRVGTRGVSAFTNLRGSIIGVAGAFVAFQGARAFLDFANSAIDAASDLEESTSKATVVFGDFFDEIEAFASTAPQALGLANAQALEFTGTFGNLFVALGLSQEAAADLAPEIVQLGADLASFNNLEVTEALEKLRAGLVGEAEPLRSLGVNLTAATVEAKAFELGLVGAGGAVSEAAKVQARYALILEQTATAQGDFARTADGIANTQRTLAGEFANVRAAVGEALLPAFQTLLEVAPALIDLVENGLVPAFASLSQSFEGIDTDGLTRTIAGLPSAVGTAFGQIGDSVGFLGNAFQGLGSIVTGDVLGAFDQFGQAAENLSDISIRQEVNSSIQNLLSTIQTGTAPLQAFESALAGLAEADLPTDQLGNLAQTLGAVAGITVSDTAGLRDLIDRIEESGPAMGFTADEVEALVRALTQLGDLDPQGFGIDFSDFINSTGEVNDRIARIIPDLITFDQNLARVGRTAAQEIDFSGLAAQFDALPSALELAGQAMETEEDEIVEDFSGFLADLEAELAAQRAFEGNLALLEAMGLDNLYDFFLEQGIEAAPALADGLTNPGELARAEALLESRARELALAEATAFGTAVGEFIAGFDPIEMPIIPVLGELDISSLPASVGVSTDVIGGRPVSGNVQVIQNFTNPETPEPDRARAGQAIAAIIRS